MVNPAKVAAQTTDRRAAVANAVASFRMEGLEPDAQTAALLEAFASGDVSIEEFGSAIERHVERLRLNQVVRKAS